MSWGKDRLAVSKQHLNASVWLNAGVSSESGLKKQIDALLSVRAKPTVRRLPFSGPLSFGRGIRIELEVDEMGFQGGSAFLFGCVMEQYFARHVSINSFTETVLRSTTRGEIMHWMPRCGDRAII